MKQHNYKEGVSYVKSFISRIIDKFGPRLPASPEERAAAEEIAKDMQEATGKSVKMESFKCAPIASIGFIPILGIFAFISLATYYLHPIISFILAGLTLAYAVIQVFLYKGWFDLLFKQHESKNVYSVLDGGEKIDYTIVFSGHIDSSWNWNLAATKRPVLLILKTVFGVVGVATILGLSLLRLILGETTIGFDGFGQIVFFIAPLVFLPGAYWLTTYLSYDKKKASPGAMDNLTGVGMSLLMAKHYRENPEELPSNCRIIVAGLGCEEAGLKGSIAFMKAHKGDNDLLINPYFINLDSFRDYEHFNVVAGDAWLMTKFTPELIEMGVESMKEAGLNPSVIKNPVGGCDSTPIVRAGYKTVTLNAQVPTTTDYYHTYNDTVAGLNDDTLEKTYEMLLIFARKIHDKNKT